MQSQEATTPVASLFSLEGNKRLMNVKPASSHDELLGLMRLLPLIFLIHDGEEIVTMSAWVERNRHRLPDRIVALHGGRQQFSIGVLFVFLLVIAVSVVGERARSSRTALHIYLVGLSALFVNVWTHVGQSLVFRGYTPGIVTAVLVVLPYSAAVYREMARERMLDRPTLVRSLAAGLGLMALIIPVGLTLGRLITRRR